MLKTRNIVVAALATTIMSIAASTASAQNPGFTANGEVIVGFNAAGGTGLTDALELTLGDATIYRDATANILNIVNIGSQLTATYGAGWFDRTDLYFGLGTVQRNANPIGGTLVNGDPSQSIYVSKARPSAGSELIANSTINNVTATTLTNASNNLISLQGRFEQNGTGSVSVLPESLTNTWEDFNAVGGTSFVAITGGGVQQQFGAGALDTFSIGPVEGALDFYRYQGRNNIPGQYGEGQPNFVGGFEGIFTIDQVGNLSFIAPVPEPGSALIVGCASILGVALRRRRTFVAA